ncbi:MAG: MazG-like family protein [Peptococcaceae bacterium]
MPEQQFDIAKNAKVLDQLKADLVGTIGTLFRNILRGSQEAIIGCLASLIITSYIIGRRLGIKFYQIDESIRVQLKNSAGSDHEVEQWFNDITSLEEYWEDMK